MKVVVSLTFPDGKAWQARFTSWKRIQGLQPAPGAAPAETGGSHHHGH